MCKKNEEQKTKAADEFFYEKKFYLKIKFEDFRLHFFKFLTK
jgi:hypothetical protein